MLPWGSQSGQGDESWGDWSSAQLPSGTLGGGHWVDSHSYELGPTGARQGDPMVEGQDGARKPGSRQNGAEGSTGGKVTMTQCSCEQGPWTDASLAPC